MGLVFCLENGFVHGRTSSTFISYYNLGHRLTWDLYRAPSPSFYEDKKSSIDTVNGKPNPVLLSFYCVIRSVLPSCSLILSLFSNYHDGGLNSHFQMAGTPTAVIEMLHKMKNGIPHKAKGEIELLKKAKIEVEGPHSLPLKPWDLSYYMPLVRNKHFANESGAELSMRVFLSLDNCVRGLGILCQRLFGIQMRVLDIPPNESWTMHMGQESKHNSGVFKLELRHSAHGPLGTVFLDLIARPDKVG